MALNPLRLGFGKPGPPDVQVEYLDYGGADNAEKGRVPSCRAGSRYPALLVGRAAERYVHLFAGNQIGGLAAVTAGIDAVVVGTHPGVDRNCPGRADVQAGIGGQLDVRFHARCQHHQVGRQLPLVGEHLFHPAAAAKTGYPA